MRFLYIALHRAAFRDEVLSELMPPLEADGTSLLWESLGRQFTGLTYQEADRLSQDNKEFIRALFPEDPLYTCLLPQDVQELIGKVGPETRAWRRCCGHRLRVRPPDRSVRRRAALRGQHRRHHAGAGHPRGARRRGRRRRRRAPLGIVCHESAVAPRFRALGTRLRLSPNGSEVGLTDAARAVLEVQPGDEVGYVAL